MLCWRRICSLTSAYADCDLVPNVLAGVQNVDMSVTVMGQKLAMPVFCSPTALQRLFHHDGERAVARAAEKFGTMFGVSALGSVRLAEIGDMISTPKIFQFYFFAVLYWGYTWLLECASFVS